MRVIVHLRAPTRVLFERRGDLTTLLHREPDTPHVSVPVMVSHKHGDGWSAWECRNWRSLNRSHVALVEEFGATAPAGEPIPQQQEVEVT